LPNKELLDQFTGFANATWRKIKSNHNTIASLRTTRELILPKLMNGDITV